jgi:hypothetical protein
MACATASEPAGSFQVGSLHTLNKKIIFFICTKTPNRKTPNLVFFQQFIVSYLKNIQEKHKSSKSSYQDDRNPL